MPKGNQQPFPQLPNQWTKRHLVGGSRRCELGSKATEEEFKAVAPYKSSWWTTIVPQTDLRPGFQETRHHFFKIQLSERFTHLRYVLVAHFIQVQTSHSFDRRLDWICIRMEGLHACVCEEKSFQTGIDLSWRAE
jgi:hypothetical protein